MTDDYEVGYGKPPKKSQFQKGVSGNPTGRPKKPVDFDQQLLQEANLPFVFTENGRPIRITKQRVAIRQLMHKAMKGDVNAIKAFRDYQRQAIENVAFLNAQRSTENERFKNARQLTEAELNKLILASKEAQEILASAEGKE
jgi:hypothetical protein